MMPNEPQPQRLLVSLVVPALDEAANVPGLLIRLEQCRRANPSFDFELVLVDDGSQDGTADALLAVAGPSSGVRVVQLARTFGSHAAISAGLRECAGACAIVLGADAQEPIELVQQFLGEWRSGHEVVWGVRRQRAGRSWRSELPSKAFSALFSRFAGLDHYPAEGPSGVLVDRCVIDEVNQLKERNRNVLALIAWVGHRQTRVAYDQLPRQHGQSRWTTAKMVKLAVDSLIQFSSMPLRLCTFLGLLTAMAGVSYAAVLVLRSAMGVATPSGWPTILVVVLVLGGMQLAVMGVMGEYLWRAVEEVRQRPLYVVRSVRAPQRTREVSPG